VSFSAKTITLRTVLKKVLGDRGLSYIVKDGIIQVLTADRARSTMSVRVYPVLDLVNPTAQPMAPAVEWLFAQSLISSIQHSVDPTIWDINGGPASITYDLANHALLVRASAEVHYSLGLGGSGR